MATTNDLKNGLALNIDGQFGTVVEFQHGETGAEIQVPLFLETGTRVKVDTRDGSYLGRVN